MSRVGLYADVQNLYFSVCKRFGEEARLSFNALMRKAESLGEIRRAVAYGSQVHGEAEGFIDVLRGLGYEPRFRKPRSRDRGVNWSAGMSVDAMREALDMDVCVIASGSFEMSDLATYLRSLGILVVVLACGICRELRAAADQSIEITAELLE